MKRDDRFLVPFSGWKNGVHDLSFEMDQAFFESFPSSEIGPSQFTVTGKLQKSETMLILDISLAGEANFACDRCGDDCKVHMESVDHWVVKFGQETNFDNEDIWELSPAEYRLDLRERLFELAHLALPARRVHARESDCSNEVISALHKHRVEENSDSRWIDLKNLQLDENDPSDEEE